jgi:hypothetical protein
VIVSVIPDSSQQSVWDFVNGSLDPIQAQIRETRAAIQELAAGLISQERLDTLKFQVANQSEQLVTLERRMKLLEQLIWLQLLSGWTVLVILFTYLILYIMFY